MTFNFRNKDVFLAYADTDKEVARTLHQTFADLFEDRVWMRDFDMDAGDLIVEEIGAALSAARWVIILLSEAALRSIWLSTDLNPAAVRELAADGVQFVVVKLEECDLPKHLRIPLVDAPVVSVSGEQDLTDAFLAIAEYIDREESPSVDYRPYEGRGADTDRLGLTLRRNRIIFIVGWRGVGKTEFLTRGVEEILGTAVLRVRLTRGHSLDRLAREILSLTKVRQPLASADVSDDELCQLALQAIKERERRVTLFLDNVDLALDGSNRLLTYLDIFLHRFIDCETRTKIVVATTRFPYYCEHVSAVADVFRLGPLEDIYIKEILLRLLDDTPELREVFRRRTTDIDRIVDRIGGHPLAARRMAGFMKRHSVDQLILPTRLTRFQVGIAEYILRVNQDYLSDLDKSILKVLAVIVEPVSLSDISGVLNTIIEGAQLDQIHDALWKLTEWFLIESDGELLFLHGFLGTYYRDLLKQEGDLRRTIAAEYGLFAYNKARELNERLEALMDPEANHVHANTIAELSNEVFRYALPADRLLRSVGREDLVSGLPIRTKGTLREMVYYFYQEVHNYRKALDYAERWLSANPNDSDIRLYRIRCYRQIGDSESFKLALRLIADMESQDHSIGVRVRLIRERAIIAQRRGDIDSAKAIYRDAISKDSRNHPYSDIWAGLARILLDEADQYSEWDERRQEKAEEAIELLEIAKKEGDNFYRYHQAAYVEGLLMLGHDDVARPLLSESLVERPTDPQLNFRMAELLRKDGDYAGARRYANAAFSYGHAPSLITLANICYEQGHALDDGINAVRASVYYEEALEVLRRYQREFAPSRPVTEAEVADAVAAKVHRTMNKLDEAARIIDKNKYRGSGNPYTVYEQAIIYLRQAEQKAEKSKLEAHALVMEAAARISEYPYRLTEPLRQLDFSIKQLREALRKDLGLP